MIVLFTMHLEPGQSPMSAKFDPAPVDKNAVAPKDAVLADEKQEDLEKGVEDTFPASDPVSATQPKPSRN
jgi:hypothetical protein